MAKDVDLSTLQMALEAMKRVRGRERQIEEGDAQVLGVGREWRRRGIANAARVDVHGGLSVGATDATVLVH